MSTAAHGRNASGACRNPGPAGRTRSPRATRSTSHTVDDTTTLPASEHPTDNNTTLSAHDSTSSSSNKEPERIKKRRRLTKSKPRQTKVIEEGDESDKDLTPLELALRELPEVV